MSFVTLLIKILVPLTYINHVRGTCPYAQLSYGDWSRDDDPLNISDEYMYPTSYNTYQTDCHQLVSQPPPILDAVMDHALNSSIDLTDHYISLDTATVGDTSAAKLFTDMDRNNFYFESVTRYIQETTCASKKTVTRYFPTVQVEMFESYMNDEAVTKVACDAGHVRYPKCLVNYPYRSLDGSCNNLERPLDGIARDCMLRLLRPDYKDGISQFKTSADGSPLPNARVLSTHLFGGDDRRPLSAQYTEFHSFLGEFVISDNGMTLTHETGLRVVIPSCDHENIQRVDHPQCAGIHLPSNDPIHKVFPNQTCVPFVRTIPCARCRLGPRMLSNSVTAAQDLSPVYGVSTEMSDARRTMVDGRLKSQVINGHEIFAVERFNATGRFRCFEGECEPSPLDVRNLQFQTAQMFALLFHRNHNSHAGRLAKYRPDWSDEQIFQEARRWNIAEYQHCIFNEYLETLIGRVLSYKFEILPKSIGQFSAYKPNAKLKTVIEFQSTAGRHGHAALNEDINIIDPITGEKSKVNFRDAAKAESIFYDGQVDGTFLGQISNPSFATTNSIPFKTFLFHMPGRTFGIDLAALDVQRQRDHGIPGYIHYIKYCHNVVVRRWTDLWRFIPAEDIEKLKKYYKNVEDIDLYTGGHYERKIVDALVGPTFACIIGIQFHNVKYGDRFFYEHGNQAGSFSIKQLNEIKTKTSFASILCKTTKLGNVSRDPLRLLSKTNQFVDCSKFVDIDYQLGVANQ
ncbi:peroxidase-like isoform X2 [Bradysia coprophila]|uniref:peroxidase-like isoform X2 n=1 Tax=Bradysia coprophila TaxID=38358 RepID=UPI00187DA8B9|nr:peroxidase-like isoform X2 [Bradysia coprophila]